MAITDSITFKVRVTVAHDPPVGTVHRYDVVPIGTERVSAGLTNLSNFRPPTRTHESEPESLLVPTIGAEVGDIGEVDIHNGQIRLYVREAILYKLCEGTEEP